MKSDTRSPPGPLSRALTGGDQEGVGRGIRHGEREHGGVGIHSQGDGEQDTGPTELVRTALLVPIPQIEPFFSSH